MTPKCWRAIPRLMSPSPVLGTCSSSAQQILRTSLHGLRKALGPALIVGDDTLAIAPGTDVDIRRFEAGVSAGADAEMLAAALALYRGDFLADFNVTDAEAFEAWADSERARYRQLAISGLATLAQRYQARQDYPAAREALARALAFNPFQEDLQRATLRLDVARAINADTGVQVWFAVQHPF